ncbi:hypothetical protein BDB00DRAFT_885531 [Zychaea mexicana]|uniref:uncharacterized protein n=1 Tax=Zychaea mexicana TaxID=64656 RepID=UPI0022FEC95A|nr:uncharacterized protein BDB00DRAFT_885531 [Zychaea mexicana]KAI9471426.1 hypothetical protein BDB00DRAFT_885531 [Zychaea mexicana]
MDVDRCFKDFFFVVVHRCISSVLVLQNPVRYETVPIEHFPPSLLATLHRDVPSILDPGLFMHPPMYHENKTSNLGTRQKLINLAMTKDGPEGSVIVADLDTGEMGEFELACSIVHPLIQSLLAYKCDRLYERYQPSIRTCFGELKVEGPSDAADRYECIIDFYRLGVFAKLEIVISNLTGVLCFQALGTTITFYALTHLHPSIYTLNELVTVAKPKIKNDIINALDDLFKMLRIIAPATNAQLPTL